MQVSTLEFWYAVANTLIGVALVCVALAICWTTARRRFAHPWLNYVVALFFVLAAAGRFSQLVTHRHAPNGIDFWIDAITGLVSIATAILIWPIALRTVRMPTYLDLKKSSDELARTNRNLEIARDHALEASKLKSSFVANISHELRTPLSAILGMSELVISTEELSEDGRMMMDAVLDAGNNLLSIVNDILDLSKIEAGKIQLDNSPFSPRTVVQDCMQLMTRTARNKALNLECTIDRATPQIVFGDRQRIRQILLNLLSNAIKFTPEGRVAVTVTVESETAERYVIKFAVEDSGIGISPDERTLLFMPFVQADNSSTRKFGGTGLGLTITIRFVEMMNGEIDFVSEKGNGSTFWFSVPFAKANADRYHAA